MTYTPTENEQKLIDALRSGKYKQSSGSLRNEAGFCCLGVACDISGVGKWIGPSSTVYAVGDDDQQRNYLPQDVCGWFGWSSNNPRVVPEGPWGVEEMTTLANMNDRGASFEDIAQVLEKGWVVRAKQ